MNDAQRNPEPITIADLSTDAVSEVLQKEERVIFAYLYGSMAEGEPARDIDIGVYSTAGVLPHVLSADLKVALSERTGIAPDRFDVRILNTVLEKGDVFSLFYLRNVVSSGRILVDKNPDSRADFLERYGTRFRECQGLMEEVLA